MLVKQQKVASAEPRTGDPRQKPAPVEKTAHVKGLEDDLRQRLAVKIEIKVKAKDKGQIVIGFDSNDDFERIIAGASEVIQAPGLGTRAAPVRLTGAARVSAFANPHRTPVVT